MPFQILSVCCSKTFIPSPKCVKTVKKDGKVFKNDILFQEICIFIENTFFTSILFSNDLIFSYDKLKEKAFYFDLDDVLSLNNDKTIYITEISFTT